jgi:hypothetical protein
MENIGKESSFWNSAHISLSRKERGYMRRNRILASTMIVAMLISLVAILGVGPAFAQPVVFGLQPYLVQDGTGTAYAAGYWVGKNVTEALRCQNVANYYGCYFWLYYNNTFLSCTEVTVNGLGSIDQSLNLVSGINRSLTITINNAYNATYGRIMFSDAFLYGGMTKSPGSFNGSGVIAYITFKILEGPTQGITPPAPTWNWENCSLTFDPSRTAMTQIDNTVSPPVVSTYPGEVLMNPSQFSYGVGNLVPGAPTSIILTSESYVTVGDTVTLDGSTSTTPAGSTITSYKWTVTGGAHLTGSSTTATTTMHCDNTTSAVISLNVTNSFGKWNVATLTLIQNAPIAMLDIYTSPGRFDGVTTTETGKGLYQPCDAITPDFNVTLYGNVTWNGQPRQNVFITWEIIYEWEENNQTAGFPTGYTLENATFAILSAYTNATGIAQCWFRIPTPCADSPYPNFPFGKWLVIGKCEFQSIECMDTMRFDCGYMVNMPWMMTVNATDLPSFVPASSYQIFDYIPILVVFKSIGYTPVSVTIAATVYDACNVPIGYATTTVIAAGGTYCHPAVGYTVLEVYVPQWAYISPPTGTVYVSLLTALPRNCGTAFCPEANQPIMLLSN